MTNNRVLHVYSGMDTGGVENLIMDLYRNIDRTKVQFDFYLTSSKVGHHEREIIEMGGKIFKSNNSYFKNLNSVLKDEKIKVVHIHSFYFSGLIAIFSKLHGKKTIVHSHTTGKERRNSLLDKMYVFTMRKLINIFSDYQIACSKIAAVALFGETELEKPKTKVIPNAIYLNKFDPQIYNKKDVLDKFDSSNSTYRLLNVGRFVEAKNHKFLLEIVYELRKLESNFKLFLVGHGKYEIDIKKMINNYELQEYVEILPQSTNVAEILSITDAMIFPSLYEGFGTVAIEAQAMNVPVFITDSDEVSKDTQLGLCYFFPLEDGAKYWAESIYKYLQNSTNFQNKLYLDRNILNKFNIENYKNSILEVYFNEK